MLKYVVKNKVVYTETRKPQKKKRRTVALIGGNEIICKVVKENPKGSRPSSPSASRYSPIKGATNL